MKRRIADLEPNPENPRKVSPEKLEFLERALREFGDLGGFVYNRETKRMVGGHQRQKVFPKNAEIFLEKTYGKPTKTGTISEGYVLFEGERFKYREVKWDETKEKAANIAANRGAGEWDLPLLSKMMKDLDAFGFDLDTTLFDSLERAQLLADAESVEDGADTDSEDLDETPPIPKIAKTKIGDIYRLGRHRLMCGDSTSIDAIHELLGGTTIDMVYTDPPYGMNVVQKRGQVGGLGIPGVADRGTYSPVIGDDSTETAEKAFSLCQTLGANIQVFWGANFYASVLPDSSGWICWDKDNGEGFFADGELAWTNQPKQLRIFKHQWKGMIKASERGEKRVHPTQKPVALGKWVFEKYGKGSKTVLDFFGGSGSTLIACEKTNRTCFMMELDLFYCDIIVTRWERITGQKAKLVKR